MSSFLKPAVSPLTPGDDSISPGSQPSPSRASYFSGQQNPPENEPAKQPPRAQTFPVAASASSAAKENIKIRNASDAFDTSESPDNDDGIEIEITRASIDLDELPIELVSLTDSFIDSLGAKVYKTPPSIEKLSQLFQDFYAQASSNIHTHISALATRQSREASPSASISTVSTPFRRKSSALSTISNKPELQGGHEQQMITTEELADRKQARRTREVKQHLLEEAVERRVCEGIYDRIYRHKSTQDEALDGKLRSKTAALAMVGIGPADLGIELGGGAEESAESMLAETKAIKERLAPARKDLARMTQSRYPLGKLNHLKAAHRSIVDTIAHFHPSASADEIMPMLIFTLITLPPENLQIISDINFIQSFRWEPKLTGEAAYCLTNLEASISFLQTVDLATLRSDELLSGPAKSSKSPKSETFPPAYSQETATTESDASKAAEVAAAAQPKTRRLSEMVPNPAVALGAASDAVLSTADQGLKTVTNSLGDSYKFFLSKIRESQEGPSEAIAVPKTLDDARKLVSTPPPEEDTASIGDASSTAGGEDGDQSRRPSAREDRVLNLIGGRRREPSTDSAISGRSAASSKLKGFFGDDKSAQAQAPTSNPPTPPVLPGMRSLSHTFMPVARFGSQIDGMFRGFGRNSIAVTPSQDAAGKPADGGDLATAFPDIAAALPPKKELPKIAPPNKRFMELQNPGDLKLNEVLDLLRDYRRLANSLQKMGAFEEK